MGFSFFKSVTPSCVTSELDSLRSPFVSTEWLSDHLGKRNIKIIDASWRMPGQGEAEDDYNKRHIHEAFYFNVDKIANRSFSSSHLPHISNLPHMMPTDD